MYIYICIHIIPYSCNWGSKEPGEKLGYIHIYIHTYIYIYLSFRTLEILLTVNPLVPDSIDHLKNRLSTSGPVVVGRDFS